MRLPGGHSCAAVAGGIEIPEPIHQGKTQKDLSKTHTQINPQILSDLCAQYETSTEPVPCSKTVLKWIKVQARCTHKSLLTWHYSPKGLWYIKYSTTEWGNVKYGYLLTSPSGVWAHFGRFWILLFLRLYITKKMFAIPMLGIIFFSTTSSIWSDNYSDFSFTLTYFINTLGPIRIEKIYYLLQ